MTTSDSPPLPCLASPPRRGGECWSAQFASSPGSWSPKASCIPVPQREPTDYTEDKTRIQADAKDEDATPRGLFDMAGLKPMLRVYAPGDP
jgi:hypothetical protein